jgi:hypothetical protein
MVVSRHGGRASKRPGRPAPVNRRLERTHDGHDENQGDRNNKRGSPSIRQTAPKQHQPQHDERFPELPESVDPGQSMPRGAMIEEPRGHRVVEEQIAYDRRNGRQDDHDSPHEITRQIHHEHSLCISIHQIRPSPRHAAMISSCLPLE